MNARVEKLLQPVSDDKPCGPDLSYDPRLDELENILKGKPEVDMGSVQTPAEPPDWKQLREKAVEFLGASKNLRVAVMFACSALRVEGLPGFRDGLQLVRSLLERYWNEVHPLLDPDDDKDPQQRLSILGTLTAPRGAFGVGWQQFIEYLCTAPLCQPVGAPVITLDDLVNAARPAPAEGEGPAEPRRDAATLAAQFRSAPPEELAETRRGVDEALEAVQGIDGFLSQTLGAANSINFDELNSTLSQLQRLIVANLPEGGGEAAGSRNPDTPRAGMPGGPAAAPAAAGGAPGAIRNRGDVVRALETICEYYRHQEPGSPVPYLLRRAQKLASMSFFEAVQELNIATVETLRPAMGSSLNEESPPA